MNKFIINGLFLFCLSISFMLTSCDTTEPEIIDYHNKILFTSSRSGKEQLYMMNPDGSNIRQITSGEYYHYGGRWSPDASKIVCNTEENSSTAGTTMVVINADGSNKKLLGYGSQMSWYPDGSKIIYFNAPSLEVGIYVRFLYIINVDGSNRITLPFVGTYPDWSPDGKNILINKPNITIVDYPGFLNIKQIGPDRSAYASWSPNGTEIAFGYTDTADMIDGSAFSKIYLMNTDGFDIRKTTNQSTKEHFSFPPMVTRWKKDNI